MGLLPDAKPRAPDPESAASRWARPCRGEAHRRYTNFVNARGRWTGHLLQSRFASVGNGRVGSDLGSKLCQAECCAGTAGRTGRGLALVKCQSTYDWSR